LDVFLGFVNRIAKAIGITRDEQLLPSIHTRETLPPRVFTREPIANQPGEKRFSFFSFLSFFSTASEKPVSQPSVSMPSYKAPPSDASIRLPYYARNNLSGNIASYFKDNNISSIDLASLGLAESPLMTAARKGNAEAVSSFLPYATLENIEDSLRALACLPSHERDCIPVTKCGKALAMQLRGHGTYIDTLHMSKEVTFLPGQTAWLEELRKR
jgi:hypothetical protein